MVETSTETKPNGMNDRVWSAWLGCRQVATHNSPVLLYKDWLNMS